MLVSTSSMKAESASFNRARTAPDSSRRGGGVADAPPPSAAPAGDSARDASSWRPTAPGRAEAAPSASSRPRSSAAS